jgi:hypothetical protein
MLTPSGTQMQKVQAVSYIIVVAGKWFYIDSWASSILGGGGGLYL